MLRFFPLICLVGYPNIHHDMCVCVCVFVVRSCFCFVLFLKILYVDCFGRTMLYMYIEYHS